MDILSIIIAIIFFLLSVFGKRLNNASKTMSRRSSVPVDQSSRSAPSARVDQPARQRVAPSMTTGSQGPSALSPDGQDPTFRDASRKLVLVSVALIAAIALAAAWLVYLRGLPAA